MGVNEGRQVAAVGANSQCVGLRPVVTLLPVASRSAPWSAPEPACPGMPYGERYAGNTAEVR